MCIDKIIEENRRFQEQIAWMKKHSPIYPQIQMKNTESEEIVAFTSIRKEHEGKWYLWLLVQRANIPIGGNAEDLIERVMLHAYNMLILGKVDTKCTHLSGEPVFTLDPDQTPETERLMKIINPRP